MSTSPTIDRRTDAELVAAANHGDNVAFELIYYRYRDWVVGHARRWTGNRDDALDVLQETFGYLIRKLPNLTLSAKMTTFLYPVVKNLALRQRERQRLTLLPPEMLDQLPSAVPRDNRLDRRDLVAVLEALPDEQREVVLLRFVDGMRLAEIGKLLQLPLGTVKSRLHYALAALRRDERIRHYFLDD